VTLDPPVPVADEWSASFWEGARAGKLLIERCVRCKLLQFPPGSSCFHCSADGLAYEEVSGHGTAYSFTETVSGARHPYFQAVSPYLVGTVELDEQEGLILASNLPGSTYVELEVRARVTVEFQEIGEGRSFPVQACVTSIEVRQPGRSEPSVLTASLRGRVHRDAR